MLERLKNEPAVIIGVLAAVVLAVVQTLGGHGIISGDLVDTVTKALDPNGGWLIPIILGLITRFFVVGPVTHQAEVTTALNTPVPGPVLTEADAAADLAGTPRP